MNKIVKKIVATTCFGVMAGLAVFGIKNNYYTDNNDVGV